MNKIIDGLPASAYTDPLLFQSERQLIFAINWLYAAHEAELPQVGDYVSTEIAGFPLILIRQADGRISCFHNICRHRGAPLVSSQCGKIQSGTLTCKYHGWSYNSCGEIAAVPHLDSLDERARQELALAPVEIAAHRGLVFIKLGHADSQRSLSAHTEFQTGFADLIQTIDSSDCDLENYAFHSKMSREGNFNWKIWVEGYQECYHCPTIHPVFNKDFHLQKYQVENRARFSLHSCQRKTTSSSGEFNGLWLWVYPNLGLPVYEPCFYTLQVLPLAVDKTRLTYTFHFRRGLAQSTIEEFSRFVEQITQEDISICQAVHHNLESGLCEKTRLNEDRENGVAYFHTLLREQLSTSAPSQISNSLPAIPGKSAMSGALTY